MRSSPAVVVTGFSSQRDPDLLQAALTDFGVTALDEPDVSSVRAFFDSDAERDRARDALRRQFPTLTISALDVPDEDWAARSQASLRAVQVGRIIVAPPWDTPSAPPSEAALVITILPSMGFGTGHHATTRLCLEALQQLDLAGRRVLDVGTGSGVLAIAASLLGAGDVVAIDDDADAMQSAAENLELNRGAAVTLAVRDVRETESASAGAGPHADVVLANLTGGLLIAGAATLAGLAAPAGRLILSGFMTHEEPHVRQAFAGCTIERRAEEDGWVCATLRRS